RSSTHAVIRRLFDGENPTLRHNVYSRPAKRTQRKEKLSTGRILVIDDEPQIRRIMRETLISSGYEVDDAKNGMEGLEKIRQFRPDLVLLDINMPDMGGVEVSKAIPNDSNIPI